MSSTCCVESSCENRCPDVCKELCIAAEVQRGAIQTIADDGVTEVTRHIFVFSVRIDNCTGGVIANVRPQLQLSSVFLRESNATFISEWNEDDLSPADSGIGTLRILYVTTSVGESNFGAFNGGLPSVASPLSNDEDTNLLAQAIRLSPGESHFNVGVSIDFDNNAPDHVVLTSAIFSFNGQMKCCDGRCLSVHRSVFTPTECLPLNDTE